MEFDHLLREYLSGSLSDNELEQFRSLLESVPEYRMELRQTLEIRSLIQDDAMNLVPPPDLSEHIRIAVGSSFAADALTEREEIERKRRVIPYAIRISASSLVAVCLMVGIALTPTLPKLPAVSEPLAAPVVTEAPQAMPSQVATSNGGTEAPPARQLRRSGARRGDGSSSRTSTTIASAARIDRSGEQVFWALGHEVPYRTRSSSIQSTSSGITQNTPPVIQIPRSTDSPRSPYSSEILSHDPAEILYRNFGASAYRPAVDDSTISQHPKTSVFEPKSEELFAMDAETGRRLAFGVTIGSGQVTENSSPTALLQKSCYMSFSVSGNDRIGVEMGASSFQQNERSPWGLGVKPNSARYNVDNIASLSYSEEILGNEPDIFFGKQTAGMPTAEDDVKGGQQGATLRPSQKITTPPAQDVRLEQQIAYGGVFYDRRFELNNSWDVCGRVTVGGADNAIMGNVRAYAAFNPTKNVTLTMGIGGSGLRNFSSKGANFSANYGVYYGIETGF